MLFVFSVLVTIVNCAIIVAVFYDLKELVNNIDLKDDIVEVIKLVNNA